MFLCLSRIKDKYLSQNKLLVVAKYTNILSYKRIVFVDESSFSFRGVFKTKNYLAGNAGKGGKCT